MGPRQKGLIRVTISNHSVENKKISGFCVTVKDPTTRLTLTMTFLATVFLALFVVVLLHQCDLVSSLASPKKKGQPGKNPHLLAGPAKALISKKNVAPTVKALAGKQTATTTTALFSSGSVTENLLCEKLSERLAELEHAVNHLIAVNLALTRRNQELESQVQDLQQPKIAWDENYNYDRFRVVELTNLIQSNLNNKPKALDSNRVYNCVKLCYDDYDEWSDNPDLFNDNFRKLVLTCLESSWFSARQRSNLSKWRAEFDDDSDEDDDE